MRTPIPLLAALSTFLASVSASPYPRVGHSYNDAGFLMPRQICDSYCGEGGAYCCTAGQVCYTNEAQIAICGEATAAVAQGEGWTYYTTTIIDYVDVPITRTETYSSFHGVPDEPTYYIPQSTAVCFAPEIACGSICCPSNKYCYAAGQCRELGGASDTIASSYLTPFPIPTSFSAPVRPTSLTITTLPVTTTLPFSPPMQTTGGAVIPLVPVESGNGLSPGAIAGIVIGVIAAIILLILILLCCCLGKGIKGIFGLFGGKKKEERREKRGSRTEIYEERRTSTRYADGRQSGGVAGGWFGGAQPVRSSRVEVVEKRKSSGDKGKLAALGLGLGGMWAGLRWKRKREVEKRRPGSSYYTRSYTGTSMSSSDRSSVPRTRSGTHRSHRTVRTHRTGDSRSRSRI